MNWNPTAKFFVIVLIVFGIAQLIPEIVNWTLILILIGMILMSPTAYEKLLNFATSIVK